MGYIYQYAPETLMYEVKDKVASKNYKLVLFDIGGVLIDYTNALKTVSKEQNIPFEYLKNTFDKYENDVTLGNMTPQELYIKTIEENNLKADTNYDFLDSWVRDYKSIKPTYDFLVEISKSLNIGLLSNIYKGMVPLLLKTNLIPGIPYKYTFLSCDIKKQKPFKEIYEYVEETTNLNPGEILLVDDKEDYLSNVRKREWGTFLFDPLQSQKSVEELRKQLSL